MRWYPWKKQDKKEIDGYPKAAKRFALRSPAQYRNCGSTDWRPATIVSASGSELVLSTDDVLPIAAELEVQFPLANPDLRIHSQVRCLCTVKHSETCDGDAQVTASISAYALGSADWVLQPEAVEVRADEP